MKGRRIRVIKLIVVGLTICIAVLVLLYIPDLLFYLRHLIKKIPVIGPVLISPISDSKYIDIMVSPLFSFVAVIISLKALQISKATVKENDIKQEADELFAALTVKDFIVKDATVIYQINLNAGDYNSLQISNNAIEFASYLYVSKRLTKSHLKTIVEFCEKVNAIIYLYGTGQDAEVQEKVKEFCATVFEGEMTKYSQKIAEIIEVLDSFSNLNTEKGA